MGREGGIARRRVVVRGTVQGVGFRWFVRETARRLGLAGRVCNRPDGTVEVEAEGDGAAIETLLAQLRVGPPGAHVMGLEMLDPIPDGASLPTPFAIDR
jgi:acylphosphatase